MKKPYIIILISLFSFVLLFSINANQALAHQSVKFGNINVEVGWVNEPALSGQLNNVLLEFTTVSDGKPIANAVAQLQVSIKKGGETKPLDFVPQEEEGLYYAPVTPTQLGKYDLVLKGTVNGQNIDGTAPLDEVQDSNRFNFPASGGGSNQLPSDFANQFKSIITDLTTQVDEAKTSADQATQSTQAMAKSVADLREAYDRAFLFGMIGVGIGAGGMIIGVIALSRRDKI
jgi:hypothetical protein